MSRISDVDSTWSFRPIEELFRTSLGTVWSALDRSTGQQLAVEILGGGTESLVAARQMVELHLRLAAPGIARVVSHCLEGDRAFVAWEPTVSHGLNRILRDEGGIPVEAALATARRILESFDEIHSAGEVHGGLATERIGGFPSLVLSGIMGCKAPVSTRRLLATEVRTPAVWEVSHDLISLGTLLWELLTRKRWDDLAPGTEVGLKCLNRMVSLRDPSIPGVLDRVVLSLAHPEAEQRATDARSVLGLLAEAERGLTEFRSMGIDQVRQTQEWAVAESLEEFERSASRVAFRKIARRYPWIDEVWERVRLPIRTLDAYRTAALSPHDRRFWITALAEALEHGPPDVADECFSSALDRWIPHEQSRQLWAARGAIRGERDELWGTATNLETGGGGPSGAPAPLFVGPDRVPPYDLPPVPKKRKSD